MDRSAIILAGGSSSRFGQDKGLIRLAGKPLIKHVLDAVYGIVDETIIVVSSDNQAENFTQVDNSRAKIIIDICEKQSPLVGALTGFQKAQREYCVLLPCDTPMVSRKVILFLLELCINKNAAIPRWPNNYIEPLQAVYKRKPSLEAAKNAFDKGEFNMLSMVKKLRRVRYVSTLILQKLDPKLKTFFNINTLVDLNRAKAWFGRKPNIR